jgi:hypothetical protein
VFRAVFRGPLLLVAPCLAGQTPCCWGRTLVLTNDSQLFEDLEHDPSAFLSEKRSNGLGRKANRLIARYFASSTPAMMVQRLAVVAWWDSTIIQWCSAAHPANWLCLSGSPSVSQSVSLVLFLSPACVFAIVTRQWFVDQHASLVSPSCIISLPSHLLALLDLTQTLSAVTASSHTHSSSVLLKLHAWPS